MKTGTWTLKLEDSYSEAPERFSQQSCFWGLGKWPVSLISWGKPPQQSPQGQSSALHCTRNCKFWLLGGFTERSPGLVPAHIASNNRLVHNEKKRKKEKYWNNVAKSLWMNLKAWWNDWSSGYTIWSNGSNSGLKCNSKHINLGAARQDFSFLWLLQRSTHRLVVVYQGDAQLSEASPCVPFAPKCDLMFFCSLESLFALPLYFRQ